MEGAIITFTELKSIECAPGALLASAGLGSAGLVCKERGIVN
jgi:hypothetical protein